MPTMVSPNKTKLKLTLPRVRAGNWRGEIVGSHSVNTGQVVQPGPPPQSVEFSYIIFPASLVQLERHLAWAGVVMVMAPTPMKNISADAGHLFVGPYSVSLHLSLEVTRCQFSDILRLADEGRL